MWMQFTCKSIYSIIVSEDLVQDNKIKIVQNLENKVGLIKSWSSQAQKKIINSDLGKNTARLP